MKTPDIKLVGHRHRTILSPRQEKQFKEWYREKAKKARLNPDPDASRHKYDYRGAFKKGLDMAIDPGDGKYHWSSEFKDEDHPTVIKNGIDTRTGKPRKRRKEEN